MSNLQYSDLLKSLYNARDEINAAIAKLEKGKVSSPCLQTTEKVIVKFPTPPGTKWEDVIIEIVSNNSIRISVREVHKRYTYAEIGFIDKRKGDLPDIQWEVLKLFASQKGTISWESGRVMPKLSKKIEKIRKRLQVVMGINNDPFYPYRDCKAYKTKFKTEDKTIT